MYSDFSTAAKSARGAIAVPALSMEVIRGRSRSVGIRERVRKLAACGALAVGLLGGAVAAKVYGGVEFWLSGGKAALVLHSFAMIGTPTAADLRRITADATFPVTFPVGMPAGTRLIRVAYAPIDRPNFIWVQYRNPRANFNMGFCLLDSSAVLGGQLPTLPGGAPAGAADAYQWPAGSETVVLFKDPTASRYASEMEAAMQRTSPAQSLAENEAILWTVRFLGGRFELPDIAQRYGPLSGGVLVSRVNLGMVPGLARAHAPMIAGHVLSFTNIPYIGRVPDYNHASIRWSREMAIPPGGVRAIAAMMPAAGLIGRWTKYCCEVLWAPASQGAYAIWTIPFSGSGPVNEYLIDAKTFAVRSLGQQPPSR